MAVLKEELKTILTVDIGNTATKATVFEGERVIQSVVGNVRAAEAVDTLLTYNSVEGICVCCVGREDESLEERLAQEEVPVLRLTPETPLPIQVDYASRATLGADRVAAAVGVADKGSVLLVDAGTAVTLDLVEGGAFRGGNISPGLRLRFHSLHDFTSRLPLVGAQGDLPPFGYDTETAIRAGVMRGLVYEIAGTWRRAAEKYDDLKLILTGGDAAVLLPLLRDAGIGVETDPDAVGRGLVRIFNYAEGLQK